MKSVFSFGFHSLMNKITKTRQSNNYYYSSICNELLLLNYIQACFSNS